VYYNFFNAAKLTVSLIFCLTFFSETIGQTKRSKEELLKALDDARNDNELLDVKIELAMAYFEVDNKFSLQNAEEAFDLATAIGDTSKIVRAGRLKGQLLRRVDRLQESIKILNTMAPIARRNRLHEDYKKILNALAVAYTFKADYDNALDFHFKSLVINEAEHDRVQTSVTLNNIGLVYFKLKNYEQAIRYYTRSLDLKQNDVAAVDLDMLLINLGLCYNQIGNFVKAQEFIRQGFATCKDGCRSDILVQGKFGLGVSFFMQKDYDQAERNFQESYKLATSTNYQRFQIENLVYLGEVFSARKEYEEAKNYFLKAEKMAGPLGYSQLLIDTYLHFSKLLNQVKDYEGAAAYQKKYIGLKDSLFNEELVKNIAKVQTNYEERENRATIASNEIVIKQSRDLNIAGAVIVLLAGLLVLVLQFGNRNIKRVNAKLSEAKEVIQEKNQELANKNKDLDFQVEKKTADLARANSSLKQVNDELDNFIYKTSHDIRGPLASLKGMCNVALMDVQDPVALDYLRKLDSTAERLNTILTRLVIINQINNSKLTVERIDFESIVSDVLLLERKKGVPAELLIMPQIDDDAIIESDKELVRIVLENLIDNAIKFYNDSDRVKSFVKIHINSMPKGGVIVRVIDNGIGISESSPGKLFQMFSRASERSETGGIGLYITKTATEKIGGKVGLLTTPEGYTEFYVIFPASPYKEAEKFLRVSSY